MKIVWMVLLMCVTGIGASAFGEQLREPAVAMEDVFEADVYPSAASAARALAARWMRGMEGMEGQAMVIEAADVPEEAREAVVAALKERFPKVRVRVNGDGPAAVRMSWIRGEKDAHVLSLGALSTKVVAKPWVEDPKAAPAGGVNDLWAVVRSQGPCSSVSAASQSARNEANLVLAQAIRERVMRMRAGQEPVDPNVLASRIDALLKEHTRSWVSDRFVRKFDRPYGALWQEAQLIHATGSQVEALASAVERDFEHEQGTRKSTTVAVVAIVLVSFLVYELANVLTKGYFAWKLRMIMTVAALLSGIAAVLWIAA